MSLACKAVKQQQDTRCRIMGQIISTGFYQRCFRICGLLKITACQTVQDDPNKILDKKKKKKFGDEVLSDSQSVREHDKDALTVDLRLKKNIPRVSLGLGRKKKEVT